VLMFDIGFKMALLRICTTVHSRFDKMGAVYSRRGECGRYFNLLISLVHHLTESKDVLMFDIGFKMTLKAQNGRRGVGGGVRQATGVFLI